MKSIKYYIDLFNKLIGANELNDSEMINCCSIECINEFVYFSYINNIVEDLYQIILLVFNDEDEVIADVGAYITNGQAIFDSTNIFGILTSKSDWLFLEYWLISNKYKNTIDKQNNIIFIENCYVSVTYRHQNIFTNMILLLEDLSMDLFLRTDGHIVSVISLDPDIPTYGSDATNETYYYSMELDEPKREINRNIAKHKGFEVVKIEAPYESKDGCKIWFAIKRTTFKDVNVISTS